VREWRQEATDDPGLLQRSGSELRRMGGRRSSLGRFSSGLQRLPGPRIRTRRSNSTCVSAGNSGGHHARSPSKGRPRLPHPSPCSLNHCSILPRSYPHVPPQSRHHPAALDVAVASVRSERALSYALPDVTDADVRLTSCSPPLNWAGALRFALVYYWSKELATPHRRLRPIREFGLAKPNRESRRADSNRFTAHYE
jgi:hypothetical protein